MTNSPMVNCLSAIVECDDLNAKCGFEGPYPIFEDDEEFGNFKFTGGHYLRVSYKCETVYDVITFKDDDVWHDSPRGGGCWVEGKWRGKREGWLSKGPWQKKLRLEIDKRLKKHKIGALEKIEKEAKKKK